MKKQCCLHEDKTNDQVARKPEVKGRTCKRSLGTMSNTASEFSLKGTLSYQYVHSGISYVFSQPLFPIKYSFPWNYTRFMPPATSTGLFAFTSLWGELMSYLFSFMDIACLSMKVYDSLFLTSTYISSIILRATATIALPQVHQNPP